MGREKFDNEKLQRIYKSMVDIDVETVPKLVQESLGSGEDVMKIIHALTRGINTVGDKFETMEYFLPQLILSAGAMDEAMKILRPEIDRLDLAVGPTGVIAIATVEGDIHDIGRNIVIAMLRASGFTVHDLGNNVKAGVVIDKALELEADIIGLSSLLTTSLPFARDVPRLMETRGVRDHFKVVMGGGAVTPEYCDDIGADGYGKDAAAAVKLMRKLLGGR
jgi:trimethylamine corrinoid protein